MAADMPGTELRGALESVFASRNRTVPTAVFVLTDGEVAEVRAGLIHFGGF